MVYNKKKQKNSPVSRTVNVFADHWFIHFNVSYEFMTSWKYQVLQVLVEELPVNAAKPASAVWEIFISVKPLDIFRETSGEFQLCSWRQKQTFQAKTWSFLNPGPEHNQNIISVVTTQKFTKYETLRNARFKHISVLQKCTVPTPFLVTAS